MKNEMAEALARVRIVLVRPTHPGNVGGVARAMANMGLRRLQLVAPACSPDDNEAQARAAEGIAVLDAAEVFDDLDAAVGDCGWLVGTSARRRRIPWPLVDAREAAAETLREVERCETAILFGTESSGLDNEDLQRCHRRLCIPAEENYSSLNLAMAVQVVCYELRQAAAGDVAPPPEEDYPPATESEMRHFYDHLLATLEGLKMIHPAAPRQFGARVRRLFSRVRMDQMEVGMMRGVLSAIDAMLNERRN